MKLYDVLYEAEGDEDLPDNGDLTPEYSDEMEVSARVYPFFEEKIEKLNKRARKLNVPSVEIRIVREFNKERENPQNRRGPKVSEPYYAVKIEGETPKLAGWDFVATIEHKEGGNIIRTVPGYADDEGVRGFFEAQPHYCAWCKKQRRRIDTFIVKNTETNEMKQVGRNCLKDFLGGTDPKAILWWFSFRDDIESVIQEAGDVANRRGAREELTTDVESVLRAAAAAVRRYGYRKSSGEQGYHGSTAHMVRCGLFGVSRYLPRDAIEHEWGNVTSNPTPVDDAAAQTVIAWWRTVPQQQKDNNNFMHTLDVLMNSQNITNRDIGFLSAIYPVYARATAAARPQNNAQQPQKSNEHLGTVGQKLTNVTVTVIRTRIISGAYGNTQIVSMEDPTGNVIEWFNNSSTELEEGKRYVISGTIKKHDQYNGRNKTVLLRVKAQEIQ
jgi:hypothetical protein